MLGLGVVVWEDGGLVLGVDVQEVVFEGQAHHTAEQITLSGQIHKELDLLIDRQAEAQSDPIAQSMLILRLVEHSIVLNYLAGNRALLGCPERLVGVERSAVEP